jgi:hypothetical protein
MILNAYRESLGMLKGTPLGDAAVERREAELNGGMDPSARKDDDLGKATGQQARKPKPFAEQPITRPRRARRRRADAGVDNALERARPHLGNPGNA